MDAATSGFFRDILLLVWLALLIGAAAYKWVRFTRPAVCWNLAGRVESRPYMPVDAVVVAALMALLVNSLMGGGKAAVDLPAGPAPPPELTSIPLVLGILINLAICAALLLYLGVARRLNVAELFGLKPQNPGRVLGLALILALPTIFVVAQVSALINFWMQGFWPDVGAQEAVQGFVRSKDPVAKALLIITAVVVAPLVEETIFRGFIYGVVKRFTDGFFAAVCSALLFALVHFHVGSFFPLTLLALVFCAVYEFTGCLFAPMLMHGLFNATSLAVLIFFGGGEGK